MKTLKEQDYTIEIYTDIMEWLKEFYEFPDNAELLNEDKASNECMGFAQLNEKIISIFVPQKYSLTDLKETIAHEIGHIIEIKYPNNPEQIEVNDIIHEMKADHYMNFYMLVDKIVSDVIGSV